jgi:hypothetical protein
VEKQFSKRKYDEFMSDIDEIPTYGIVTTANDWTFLRYCHTRGGYQLVQSPIFALATIQQTSEEAREDQVRVLMLKICGLLSQQMDSVDAYHDKKRTKSAAAADN